MGRKVTDLPYEQLTTSDTAKLRLLVQVGRLISGQIDLKPLIMEVVEQTHRLQIAHRSTFWLYDRAKHELYTFIGDGLENEIRIPASKGVAGAAVVSREIVNIENAYESRYFNPDVDRQTGYVTRSLLAIPMLGHDNQILGCYQAVNRLDPAGEQLKIRGETAPVGVGVFHTEDEEILGALAGFAAVAVENAMLYQAQRRQFNSFIITLAQSIDAKDPTTSNHTKMVTGVAVALAHQLGLSVDNIERIRIASILHDYGKIGVPDRVLNKAGKLDDEEFQQMRSHALKSRLVLSRIVFGPGLEDVPKIASEHHEKVGGGGYPFGLRGDELSLESRIIAVADVFQAMTQTRPYKEGFPPEDAYAECLKLTEEHTNRWDKHSPRHLDINVVRALGEILEAHDWQMGYFEEMSGWEQMLTGEI